MAFRRRRKLEPESAFKDYYLILQVHPAADAGMIDAAYWHLARRYGEERLTKTSAKGMMDDLNEAYTVLRSSERRDQYDRNRNLVLGDEALPLPPPPAPEPQPLMVMERQTPHARTEEQQTEIDRQSSTAWTVARAVVPLVSAAIFLALTTGALLLNEPVPVIFVLVGGIGISLLGLLVLIPHGHPAVERPRKPLTLAMIRLSESGRAVVDEPITHPQLRPRDAAGEQAGDAPPEGQAEPAESRSRSAAG